MPWTVGVPVQERALVRPEAQAGGEAMPVSMGDGVIGGAGSGAVRTSLERTLFWGL